jgi:hypothetical protein
VNLKYRSISIKKIDPTEETDVTLGKLPLTEPYNKKKEMLWWK